MASTMLSSTIKLKKQASTNSAFELLCAKLNQRPAGLALGLQCLALLIVFISAKLIVASLSLYIQTDFSFLLFSLVILQAGLSTSLAYVMKMPIWWRWIHAVFPIALWFMSTIQIPNSVYLTGFIISLSLYWTIFKTRVPFYPSRPAVWKALYQLMQQHAKPKQALSMIDIGSGLGDMSMYIAKMRVQDRIQGIEIAPLPWLISFIRAQFKQSNAKFILGNYERLDFSQYDVVFAYLSPAAMPNLWQKASKEMRTGSLLVSLEFEVPDILATQIILPSNHSPKLYVWRIA